MSLKALIEAALFVSQKDLTSDKLSAVLGGADPKLVKAAADELVMEYGNRDGGIEVYKAGRAYGMRVKSGLEEGVTSLIPETEMPKAMLRTLAMIAYEQPIKQSYIVKIRGNRVYYYLGKLEQDGFIERKVRGHTKMISTTAKFKKYFKINDTNELIIKSPNLGEKNQKKLVEEQ